MPNLRLIALLVALASIALVSADPTAFGPSLVSKGGRDAEGCGRLDGPCCLSKKAGAGRCRNNLACVPGQMRCLACGGETQPACDGAKCDPGLAPFFNLGPAPLCLPTSRNTGSAGSVLPRPLANIGVSADDRRKRDSDTGKKAMRSCLDGNTCERGACVGGMCVPCGGPKQPCCAGNSCRQFDGDAMACQFDQKLAANACVKASKK